MEQRGSSRFTEPASWNPMGCLGRRATRVWNSPVFAPTATCTPSRDQGLDYQQALSSSAIPTLASE